MKGLSVFTTALIQGLLVGLLAHLALEGFGPRLYFAGVGGAYMMGSLIGAYLAQGYWDGRREKARRQELRAWRAGRRSGRLA